MIAVGKDSTDKLIRDAEKIREDLLKLAGAVEAWTQELSASSGALRDDQAVREGIDCDDSGESAAGPGAGGSPDPGGHGAEPERGGHGQ